MSSKDCIALLAREYWHKGELVSSCCCMLIGYSDNSWQKVLYNDEEYIWEIEDSDEVPNILKPEGDDEFYYPYKSFLPENLSTIGKFKSAELIGRNKIVLQFSLGLQVTLVYDEKLEKEYIEVNT